VPEKDVEFREMDLAMDFVPALSSELKELRREDSDPSCPLDVDNDILLTSFSAIAARCCAAPPWGSAVMGRPGPRPRSASRLLALWLAGGRTALRRGAHAGTGSPAGLLSPYIDARRH